MGKGLHEIRVKKMSRVLEVIDFSKKQAVRLVGATNPCILRNITPPHDRCPPSECGSRASSKKFNIFYWGYCECKKNFVHLFKKQKREIMKKKIWIRLGGFIEVGTENELEKIMGGDKSVLMSVIRRNGFEVNGDSYIPSEDGNEVGFDFNGNTKLR